MSMLRLASIALTSVGVLLIAYAITAAALAYAPYAVPYLAAFAFLFICSRIGR